MDDWKFPIGASRALLNQCKSKRSNLRCILESPHPGKRHTDGKYVWGKWW
jgi:hypothetical protein